MRPASPRRSPSTSRAQSDESATTTPWSSRRSAAKAGDGRVVRVIELICTAAAPDSRGHNYLKGPTPTSWRGTSPRSSSTCSPPFCTFWISSRRRRGRDARPDDASSARPRTAARAASGPRRRRRVAGDGASRPRRRARPRGRARRRRRRPDARPTRSRRPSGSARAGRSRPRRRRVPGWTGPAGARDEGGRGRPKARREGGARPAARRWVSTDCREPGPRGSR